MFFSVLQFSVQRVLLPLWRPVRGNPCFFLFCWVCLHNAAPATNCSRARHAETGPRGLKLFRRLAQPVPRLRITIGTTRNTNTYRRHNIVFLLLHQTQPLRILSKFGGRAVRWFGHVFHPLPSRCCMYSEPLFPAINSVFVCHVYLIAEQMLKNI